jgi:hypothetical protein
MYAYFLLCLLLYDNVLIFFSLAVSLTHLPFGRGICFLLLLCNMMIGCCISYAVWWLPKDSDDGWNAVLLTCFRRTHFVPVNFHMLNGIKFDACQTHGASSHVNLTSKENFFGAKDHMWRCMVCVTGVGFFTNKHMKASVNDGCQHKTCYYTHNFLMPSMITTLP